MQIAGFLSYATSLLLTAGATPVPPPDGMTPSQLGLVFQNYSGLYARIIADRHLRSPNEEDVARQLQAQSKVEQFRDGSADPIAVIRVELLGPDGASRTRSKEGNYPFYVVHESKAGLVLMGTMFGRDYKSVIANGTREFFAELLLAGGEVRQMHYRVEGEKLINLSPLPRGTADFIAHGA